MVRRDAGSSASIGLTVAAAIFMLTLATLPAVQRGMTDDTGLGAVNLEVEASTLSQRLLDRGLGWYFAAEGTKCIGGRENAAALNPEAVGILVEDEPFGVFGLGEEGCHSRLRSGPAAVLSYPKMANLYASEDAATSNGRVDYEEAHRSLGLGERGLQFHVRSWPILPKAGDVLATGQRDANLRVAYVGDYHQEDRGAPVTRMVQHRAGVTDGIDAATTWVEVTNNGTTPTTFEIHYTLKLAKGTIYFTRHTPILDPGEAYKADTRLWKSNDWQWPDQGSNPGSIRLCTIVADSNNVIGSGANLPPASIRSYGRPDPPGYSSVGAYPPTEFATPVVLNADLLHNDGIKDASCVTHSNLPLGGYFYGMATITGSSGWAEPKYNDQNTHALYNLNDFFVYSGQLFDSDPNNDGQRNTNADGHIVLTSSRPMRTVAVLAHHVGGPGGYTGPANPRIAYPHGVSYVVNDVAGKVGEGDIDFGNINMGAAVERNLLFVAADKPWYNLSGVPSVNAKVGYVTYEGDGRQETFSNWDMRLFDEEGDPLGGARGLKNTISGSETFTLSSAATYTARLENNARTLTWNEDVVNVARGPVLPFTPASGLGDPIPQPSTLEETRYLDLLLADFTPAAFSPAYGAAGLPHATGGDVYPDVKDVLNNHLTPLLIDDRGTATPVDDVPTLARYNVLVVGSNVDHQAMTSPAAKDALAAWVGAGGTLIVFGSGKQDARWLDPLFRGGLETANGGLYTPDATHPVLNAPNKLQYEGFRRASTWVFHPDDVERFSHVVKEGPSDADPDLLAVSNAGTVGLGRLAVTGYRPYDLTADQAATCPAHITPQDACQGLMLVQNLLTQAYRELFLDYGPPIPDTSANAVRLRIGLVDHPDYGPMSLEILTYVFHGG